MAVVKLSNSLPDYEWIPQHFEPNDPSRVTSSSASSFKWTNSNGTKVELFGTGFSYLGGVPSGGTVTSITLKGANNSNWYTVTELNADLSDLYFFAFGWDRPDGDDRHNANGKDFLNAVLSKSDKITGTDQSDDLMAGAGNDTVAALGGDDYINADAGKDKIDGGDGWDTLSYSESFFDVTAFRGIIADLTLGTIKDSWGKTDTVLNIEEIRGSRFADQIIGNSGDNSMEGLRGTDTLIGGDGYDDIRYNNDERYGGKNGIVVDLTAGTVRDGFGQTDSVAGIERIIGTRFADAFKGDADDNDFQGQAGADSYDGGDGNDRVILRHWDNQVQGAVVDLTKASGQIVNDGFGNTETLINIEAIEGTENDDSFKGNGEDNRFRGRNGDDTMTGGGGGDRLEGGLGIDTLTGNAGSDTFVFDRSGNGDGTGFGDTITDFVSGTDRIALYTPHYDGMSSDLQFRNGSSAGGTGSWFFFNAADNGFYWDADGTGAGAAVKVATLSGVTSLAAGDIELWT